jgi:hypothetical protein
LREQGINENATRTFRFRDHPHPHVSVPSLFPPFLFLKAVSPFASSTSSLIFPGGGLKLVVVDGLAEMEACLVEDRCLVGEVEFCLGTEVDSTN